MSLEDSKSEEKRNDTEISFLGPQLLTIDQFCAITNTGKTKVYAEIAAGRLKAKKYGRCTRITREAAHDWINNLPAFDTQN